METDGRARLFTIRAADRGNTAAVLAGVVFAVLLMLGPTLSTQAYAAPTPSSAAQKFYVVGAPVDGQREFLFAIAAQTLGDGKRYREIFDLNRGRPQPDGRIMNDPTVVESGWILLLPDDARGPGVRTGPLPSVPPPTNLPSAGTSPAPAEAEPEADEGGVSPSLLATAAGLLLAALTVPLLLRRSRRVPASTGPAAEAAATSRPRPPREAEADTAATGTPPAATGTVKLPLVRGLPRLDAAPEPPVTTRPSAAPVASTTPTLAGPDTPASSPSRPTPAGPADAPAAPPRLPAVPPPVDIIGAPSATARPNGRPSAAAPPNGTGGGPPTTAPPTTAPRTAASGPDRQPPTPPPTEPPTPPPAATTSPTTTTQAAPVATRAPRPPASPLAEPQAPPPPRPSASRPAAPQPSPPRPTTPQPPAGPPPGEPQSGVRPQPVPTQPAPPSVPATSLASPQPVSPPPVAAPRPVTPLTPATAPKLVSAPLASARPTPVPAPRPAVDDLPPSIARLIPVESPEVPADPTSVADREAAVEPSAQTPAPVVTGLRRAVALPTGDLQRVAGIGSLAATAPGWFPPLVTDLDVDATPATVRLVGARPARWGSAYGWLEEGWRPPPSSIPVVLGEHDGRRLWVDLAAAPDVLTLGGDEDASRRLAVRLLDQLGPSVDVVVVGDALGAEPPPPRCHRLDSVGELAGLEPAALRVVFCPGASAGVLWRERRSLTASGQRTVPVLVGEAPPARWSVRAMAGGPAS
ncbi:hypothetical protein [Micromonospora sp. NPDC005324]|uniref:hypothetical protein n=1 Tax=Micromonospora sp. NPDC005324 TaxID=3157033 RepID=UPI0033BCB45F